MKRLLLITLSIFWMVSCTKEERNSDTSKDYLLVVQNGLKDSLSATDFEALDFSRAVMSKVDSFKFYFLRIPFKGTSIASDFVMMRTVDTGRLFLPHTVFYFHPYSG